MRESEKERKRERKRDRERATEEYMISRLEPILKRGPQKIPIKSLIAAAAIWQQLAVLS